MTLFTPSPLNAKQRLEVLYQEHHTAGQRYGYLFCNGQRGPHLSSWIGSGKKVLDIGCRDGMLTSFFSSGNEVLGVDIDREALRRAELRLGIGTEWLDVNEEFPFPDGSFDVVVACEVMEHLYHTADFLKNVHRCLRPGGLFLGSVPNSFRLKNRLRFLMGKEYEPDPTHVHQFSPASLRQWLCRYFAEVHITYVGGKALPFIPVSSYCPATMRQLCAKDQLWRCVKH